MTSIGGSLIIKYNDALASLSGLENVTTISQSLEIEGNMILPDLDPFGDLMSIGGDLEIRHNSVLMNLSGLRNMSSIAGKLSIEGNNSLSHINGLSKVNALGGELIVSTNKALQSLNGLNNITSILGGLSIINNNELISLAGLEGLTEINGELLARENNKLASINELGNIDAATITELNIFDNPSLSACAIESVCNYLASPNGITNIYGNAPGCDSQQEVKKDCPLSIEDPALADDFVVSPNPIGDKVVLLFNPVEPGEIVIDLFNSSGSSIYNRHFKFSQADEQHIVLDMNGHPTGVYFLRVIIAGKVSTRKILKL